MSRVLGIFRFRRKSTPLHALDPRAKFALLVALSAASLALSDAVSLSALLIVEAALLAVARSLREWARSLTGLSSLLILIFVLNFLTLPADRLFVAAAMALRFLCLTTAFSIFFLTTTADELAAALEASGVPREYSMMFTMSLRFVPSLARDLQTVADALKSRGLELEKGGLRERLRNYTYLLVPLIVYELRRSIMVAEALEARGFGAVGKVEPYVALSLRARDLAVIIVSALAACAVIWVVASGAYGTFLDQVRACFPRL